MGRPQKPFVVEVKRGRRGGVSALPTTMLKEPAPEAIAERRPAPPREPPKPQRRILDAIEPAPAPQLVSEPVSTVAVGLVDPPKRRRGRPPKAAAAPAPETKRPVVARRVKAPVVPVARREFLPVPDRHTAASVMVAPRVETKKVIRVDGNANGHMTHGHMTHGDRLEAATALPRGERWKRRLPKVLW